MVKAPTPEEEDRRRLCRERKILIAERVKHVNLYPATSHYAAIGGNGSTS